MATSRLFWIVSRSASTMLCRPSNAPSAPACITGDAHEVVWACTLFITVTIFRGATHQPMRNPVMPYSFAIPLTTISRESSRSLVVKR